MKLLITLLALIPFCGSVFAADPPRKPNIILILADDLGIPGIGACGGAYKTPNIDALAASGTRFEHCFSAPLCGPSRAMLLTGRYAFRTGVIDNGYGAAATPEKDGSVALLLKQAGYATAVSGKWRQLSHFTSKEDGAKWGFDEFLIWGAGAAEEGEEGEAKQRRKDKAKATEKTEKAKPDRYWNAGYNRNGKALNVPERQYGPDVLQEFVVDFIRRHKDGPFFVYYPIPLIHGPILRTPDSAPDAEKLKKKRDPANVMEGSLYADNIAYLDKLVGKLVAELDALKLRENTLVIFTGDNGSVPIGTVRGRRIDGKKSNLLEGGSRVPLIANWTGTTPSGKVVKDLVDFSDMLPTFVELAGGKVPTDRPLDGRSFAPQLRGETGQPREWAYVQLRDERYVRSDRWKLTGGGELFDMKDAPYQQVLVPADTKDESANAARAKLQAALDKLVDNDAKNIDTPKKKRAKKKAAAATQ